MRWIDDIWYKQNNPLTLLLMPLSWVYCAIISLRRWLYQNDLMRRVQLDRPVIIIGNITVGGTGKTPLIVAACELLKSRGFKPGVISRGYGGDVPSDTVSIVETSSDASETGDEPLLIKRRTECPVYIGRDRVKAGKMLIDDTDCDIILSDDGLQHYRLHRDHEIAVIDSARRFGNEHCIPAGPLREPVSRLSTVDLSVYNMTGASSESPDFSFSLKMNDAVSLSDNKSVSLGSFSGKSVHAIAGIGHPERFFSQLRSYGIDVIEHAFPDHHHYEREDFSFDDVLPVLMTEKDAVKCMSFDLEDAWMVPVVAVLSKSLEDHLLNMSEVLRNG